MAKSNIPIEVKRTADLYDKAYKLHNEIKETYADIESNEMTYERNKIEFSNLEKKINKLQSILSKIDPDAVSGYIPNDRLDTLKHNIKFYTETANYIEKRLMAAKYYKPLLNSVRVYIDNLIGMVKYDLKLYAKDEEELAKKFTAMLLHPDNIEMFKNHIKRMLIGTMSQNEFKKIYAINKTKMSRKPKYNFESFKEYKS
jgi:hypothetical protein